MKKLILITGILLSGSYSARSQEFSFNISGAVNSTNSMVEVLQTSTTAASIGIYSLHSGAIPAGTGYALWAEKTGASSTNIAAYFKATGGVTDNYSLIVPSGGGKVGIGIETPSYLLHVYGSGTNGNLSVAELAGAGNSGAAITATNTQTAAGNRYGFYGTSSGAGGTNYGIYCSASNGFGGYFNGGTGYGVYGTANGTAAPGGYFTNNGDYHGLVGTVTNATYSGIYGYNDNASGTAIVGKGSNFGTLPTLPAGGAGVAGYGKYGVFGNTTISGGYGVFGQNTSAVAASQYGVWGEATGANAAAQKYGIYGSVSGAAAANYGMYGTAAGGTVNYSVYGSEGNRAVCGITSVNNATGVYGENTSTGTGASQIGVYGRKTGATVTGTGYGVYGTATGTATTNYAGYFTASDATTNYGLYVNAGGTRLVPLASGVNGAILRTNSSGDLSITNFSGSSSDVLLGNNTFGTIATAGGVTGSGTANYNAYWSSASALGSEQYVNVTRGGLGANMTAGAIGAIPYSTSTTAYGTLADVATGSALISGGAGLAPSWGKIGMTTHTSAGAWKAFYSNATGVVTEIALGGAGTYLQSAGAAAAPTWATPSGCTGSGTTPQVAYWTSATNISSPTGTAPNILQWDNTNSRLGIGIAPSYKLHVVEPTAGGRAVFGNNSYVGITDGYGGYFVADNAANYGYGIYASGGYYGGYFNLSSTSGIAAVYGTAAGATSFAIRGNNTNLTGTGVAGAGNNIGISYLINGSGGAFSSTNVGVYGYGNNTANSYGVYGVSDNATGTGVMGIANVATGKGVYGWNTAAAGAASGFGGWFLNYQTGGAALVGTLGENSSFAGAGVSAIATSTVAGGKGAIGACNNATGRGLHGQSSGASGYGVYGINNGNIAGAAIFGGHTAGVAGTGFTLATCRGAIEGQGAVAGSYGFGVIGSGGAAARSGGVLGDNYNTTRGALGYYNSASVNYGVYAFGSYLLGVAGGKMLNTGDTVQYNDIGIGAYAGTMGAWIRGIEYGTMLKGDQFSLYVEGKTYTNNFIVQLDNSSDETERIPSYVSTSTSVDIMDKGTAKLVNGKAYIRFNSNFSKVVSEKTPITVTATPNGKSSGIYIESVTKDGFYVVENNGTSDVQFCWIAIGTKAGYETPVHSSELLSVEFDRTMDGVMYNDADTTGKGTPIWWDGFKMRHDTPPLKFTQRESFFAEEVQKSTEQITDTSKLKSSDKTLKENNIIELKSQKTELKKDEKKLEQPVIKEKEIIEIH